MYLPEFTKRYINRVLEEQPLEDFKNFQEAVANSKAILHGKPIPVTYQGMFYERETIEEFKEIVKIMVEIGQRVEKAFLESEEVRRLYGFPQEMNRWILHEPLLKETVPIGRYDIMYNGPGDFKFCELNTDGSSAMNEEAQITPLFLKTKVIQSFPEKKARFELIDSLVKYQLKTAKDILGKTPRVAIVDLLDRGTTSEFEVFRQSFEEQGAETSIEDIRDLRYEDGRLLGEGGPIDLVYRRIVTADLYENREECKDFLKAYFDNAFLMIGSFRSQIMHGKRLFELFGREELRRYLTPEQCDFLDQHIPKTKTFGEEDFSEVLHHREKYILKPADSYASQGILSGREYSSSQWETVIRDALDKDYIVQEFFDVDKTPFVVLEGDRFAVSHLGHVIGMFLYGGRFSGLYTRIGAKSVISGASQYFMAPNIVVGKED